MFHPVQSSRLHKQVFEQIQDMVLKGSLKPGDKLPSERELSALLKVSRNSIREAIRSLEMLGVIECRQGGGNFVRFDIGAGLIEPLSLMFQLHGGSLDDLLEARKALELKAASLAAARITGQQALELQALVDALQNEKSENRKIQLDKDFHFKIAEISGNVLLLAFLSAISSLLERAITAGRRAIIKGFRNEAQLQESHADICKAIVSRNPAAAEKAVEGHFKMVVDKMAES